MNTKNTMHEQISAFADGEADESQIDIALAALRTPEGKTAWEDYHRIGDALRSDDMAFPMSADFSSKLMRRLEDEPPIVAAPRREQAEQPVHVIDVHGASSAKRFMLPGMAAAVMAVLTVVVAQQWLGGVKGSSGVDGPAVGVVTMASAPATTSVAAGAAASTHKERDLVRDPGIDEYLLAHQRFSPSVYSTAQYARSATFAVDSDK
ncbi:MAG TPA: sigma-E factor negative regulatory protein [Paucimonas sp.]|nr:sigma-E factor negative regulatory protein [Paucimonas sp.]